MVSCEHVTMRRMSALQSVPKPEMALLHTLAYASAMESHPARSSTRLNLPLVSEMTAFSQA